MFKQFTNTSLHLNLQEKPRLQKTKAFERNYCVFQKSPRISPKGHQNKRTKESASHHILLRHLRCFSKTQKQLWKTSRTPFRANPQTSHVWSHFSWFESRKSLQIHICIMLKRFTNAYLHLSLQEKPRLQKSKVFERNYYVLRESPRISPKRHQNKRTKESASHHILLRHLRCVSKTSKHLRKTFRTPSGGSLRHLMSGVVSVVLRAENHCKFILGALSLEKAAAREGVRSTSLTRSL